MPAPITSTSADRSPRPALQRRRVTLTNASRQPPCERIRGVEHQVASSVMNARAVNLGQHRVRGKVRMRLRSTRVAAREHAADDALLSPRVRRARACRRRRGRRAWRWCRCRRASGRRRRRGRARNCGRRSPDPPAARRARRDRSPRRRRPVTPCRHSASRMRAANAVSSPTRAASSGRPWSRAQEEPVAAPRDVAVHDAMSGTSTRHLRRVTIRRHVGDGDGAVVVQRRRHVADRRLDAVRRRLRSGRDARASRRRRSSRGRTCR